VLLFVLGASTVIYEALSVAFLNPSISVSVERRFLVLPRRLGEALIGAKPYGG
jgi:hypothetical protein